MGGINSGRRHGNVIPFHPEKRDWVQVMVDLYNAGICSNQVARHLGVPYSTAENWAKGAEPGHSRGEALLKLHIFYTEKKAAGISSTVFSVSGMK